MEFSEMNSIQSEKFSSFKFHSQHLFLVENENGFARLKELNKLVQMREMIEHD